MATIFHIVSEAAWDPAQGLGRYEAASLSSEGFIHCSRSDQVIAVANARFRGRADLLLLRIERSRVTAPVRDDTNEDGVFPHVYGALNLDAVVAVLAFPPRSDGTFEMPGGQ